MPRDTALSRPTPVFSFLCGVASLFEKDKAASSNQNRPIEQDELSFDTGSTEPPSRISFWMSVSHLLIGDHLRPSHLPLFLLLAARHAVRSPSPLNIAPKSSFKASKLRRPFSRIIIPLFPPPDKSRAHDLLFRQFGGAMEKVQISPLSYSMLLYSPFQRTQSYYSFFPPLRELLQGPAFFVLFTPTFFRMK